MSLKVIFMALLLCCIPVRTSAELFEISVDESGFSPSSLTIHKGDFVRWINKGTALHGAASGTNGVSNGMFSSGPLNPGVSYMRFFANPGKVEYFDISSPSKVGAITISDEAIIISPRDSRLLDGNSTNITFFLQFENAQKMTVVYDGAIVYDGRDLLDLGFIRTPDLAVTLTKEMYAAIVFPIKPFSLTPGIHTLSVSVLLASGKTLTDSVTYTVVEVSPDFPAGDLPMRQ